MSLLFLQFPCTFIFLNLYSKFLNFFVISNYFFGKSINASQFSLSKLFVSYFGI